MNGSILIVDDSLTVRMDLSEALERAGFTCTVCGTVREARGALAGGDVVLVVLDVQLPDGDGVELLREIREKPETMSLPVLMLSAEAEVKDRIRGLTTGADDYVGKPYDMGYLVARARELLATDAPPSDRKTTILVVDDSTTFREELTAALGREGYAVISASSGEEGLRLAATRRPHAILVDGVMPGIDGATLIRRVRLDSALRGTPCVLLTADDSGNAELRALDAGADAFVRKEEDLDVILARLSAVLRSAGAEPSGTASLASPKRILAVDDSPTYLNELSALLRAEGYEVVPARSGEEAIEMLAVQQVDCILLDLLMPGLGGKETCKRIKSTPALRDIPLVILTALADRSAMIDSLGLGADDYISKLSEFDVLEARVRAQLRRKQFESEHRRVREELMRTELEASEARAARKVAETRAALVEELERKNRELEAFSYSVSHDLRAPLRAIDGFSQVLLEDYAETLDERALGYLKRVRAAAQRMGELIDDILELSRVGRADLRRSPVNVSELAKNVLDDLVRKEPERKVETHVEEGLRTDADPRLLRILLENLLGNALKFTAKTTSARIDFGTERRDGATVYFVRDNGAGFNMAYAAKLFTPFQRLHDGADFPGTGVGLATVHRIVDRHGGRVWAEGVVDKGATVFFTLPPSPYRRDGA